MNPMLSTDVQSTEVQSTELRPTMYQLLEAPFIFPTIEGTRSFIDCTWQQQVTVCAEHLGYSLPEALDHRLTINSKDFEVEFISLFEVGMGGAPCPLHSGHYKRDRLSTMEEVLRFYRFFDFHLDRSADRFPDHINFELQFMAHLAETYQTALVTKGDVISPLLAQRDFVTRNLMPWVPQLADLIEQKANMVFFKQASRILSDFVAFDSNVLEQLVSQSEAA